MDSPFILFSGAVVEKLLNIRILMTRILLANDKEGQSRILPLLVGFTVSIAETAKEGLKHLANSDFDLIITGVHFDDSRAIEFLKTVRDQPGHERTPFLFVRTRPSMISDQLRASINSLDQIFRISGYLEAEFLAEDKVIRSAVLRVLNLPRIDE